MKAILGKKLGMTQIFKDGKLIPVTVVEAGPCLVTQIKTKDTDGYNAVQIGYKSLKKNKVTKPVAGHFAKNKLEPKKHLAEFAVEKPEEYQLGQKVSTLVFQTGDKLDVTAVSKGKGFAGVMKRWNFSGGPGGHGSHFHRAPGSVGMAATPSRVFKGMKLPGQMGSKKVTAKNLEIADIVDAQDVILIKGAVPGASGTTVLIKSTNEIAPPRPVEEKAEEKKELKGEELKTEEKKELKGEELKAEEKKELKGEELKAEEKKELKGEELKAEDKQEKQVEVQGEGGPEVGTDIQPNKDALSPKEADE